MDFKWFLCCCFVIVTFDPATTDQTSTISTPATPTGERLIGKSELACQRYTNIRANFEGDAQKCIVKRVINGNPVERNEFPHMVALGYDRNDENDTSYDFLCGGTLISDKFVLTAFHCVGRRNAVPRIARLGKTSLLGNDCNNAIDVKVIVDYAKFHKDYNARAKHNNIALLELETSVAQFFGRNVYPACLHHGFDPISDLIVTGWGLTVVGDDVRPTTLHKAELQEITLNQCKKLFEELPVDIIESHLCATSPMLANACHGDSGGPLQYKLNDTYYIAGIVSFGVSCGSTFPDVYTRVSSYIDWIEEIVW